LGASSRSMARDARSALRWASLTTLTTGSTLRSRSSDQAMYVESVPGRVAVSRASHPGRAGDSFPGDGRRTEAIASGALRAEARQELPRRAHRLAQDTPAHSTVGAPTVPQPDSTTTGTASLRPEGRASNSLLSSVECQSKVRLRSSLRQGRNRPPCA
jgi:hypothetical protein